MCGFVHSSKQRPRKPVERHGMGAVVTRLWAPLVLLGIAIGCGGTSNTTGSSTGSSADDDGPSQQSEDSDGAGDGDGDSSGDADGESVGDGDGDVQLPGIIGDLDGDGDGDESTESGQSSQSETSTDAGSETGGDTQSDTGETDSTGDDTADSGDDGDLDPDAVGYEYVVHIAEDADMSQLQAMADRYVDISQRLWTGGLCQQYIKTLRIEDKKADDPEVNDVFIYQGDLNKGSQSNPFCPGGASACVNWWGPNGSGVIYGGGTVSGGVWGHEHGHYAFYFWEEYDAPKCKDCFMADLSSKYCDESYHVQGAQKHQGDNWEGSCWDIITKYTRPDWVFPDNPGCDPMSKPPTIEFTLVDN